MFASASSSVSPSDQQPSNAGTETLIPSSLRYRAILYFMETSSLLVYPCGEQRLRRSQLPAESQQQKHFRHQEQRRVEDLQEVVGQCRPLALEGMTQQLNDPAAHERREKQQQGIGE